MSARIGCRSLSSDPASTRTVLVDPPPVQEASRVVARATARTRMAVTLGPPDRAPPRRLMESGPPPRARPAMRRLAHRRPSRGVGSSAPAPRRWVARSRSAACPGTFTLWDVVNSVKAVVSAVRKPYSTASCWSARSVVSASPRRRPPSVRGTRVCLLKDGRIRIGEHHVRPDAGALGGTRHILCLVDHDHRCLADTLDQEVVEGRLRRVLDEPLAQEQWRHDRHDPTIAASSATTVRPSRRSWRGARYIAAEFDLPHVGGRDEDALVDRVGRVAAQVRPARVGLRPGP